MVRKLLDRITGCELTTGVQLSRLKQGQWLPELEFHVPAPRLHADTLNALLADAGYEVAPLAFRRMEGYLKGFIDLVFEADGRYYLLDWKSNHLGYLPQDYDHAGIAMAMAEHGYHLQYLLYTLALHRYLGQRVPGYAYDTHFGGVLYLFLRGIRPDWTNPDGSPSGVLFHKPPASVIEALDALFHLPTQRSAP
ncbi:PD-(D/E)XK nuclease family protein [Actimicrobium sp. CCI2.3]|uniref:PD-(D/E)XK nuclease family protein n=1 Tax=Actimicrobium sp. CCI2.3 TaxID=3048616 RepID=UPI002AB52815|nr:PD-(D/E)XK nuclease family protein [Actimicrobium sp. CCI2.3]MDY7574465.1 PD-(D/E)XK nuclease family protein [Actimicrobium sp. CCI2.3]MEB0022457.1 PD-(D/E)XK nuclease family protein [Actimicrobium sp. CCI2.3]